MYQNPTVNIILTCEILTAFFLSSGGEQNNSPAIIYNFQPCTEGPRQYKTKQNKNAMFEE